MLPKKESPDAAGYDLTSAVQTIIPARGRAMIPADLAITVPEGTYGRIAPRSGLAWKSGIDVGAGVFFVKYKKKVNVRFFVTGN